MLIKLSCLSLLRRRSLLKQSIELRILVISFVRTIAICSNGSKFLSQVVFWAWVIWHPACTPCTFNLTLFACVTELLECWNWSGFSINSKMILEGVYNCVEHRLSVAIGVVSKGKRTIILRDLVCLCPKFLSLCGIKLKVFMSLKICLVSWSQRRSELVCRRCSVVKNLLDDGFAVDCHRNSLTTQAAFFGSYIEMWQFCRNTELLDYRTWTVVCLHSGVLLESLGFGIWNVIGHIKIARLNIAVSSGAVGVDLKGNAVILSLAWAIVIWVLYKFDLLVVIPRLKQVWSRRNWFFAISLWILVEGFWKRSECKVTNLNSKHRIWLVQINSKGVLIYNL